MTIKVKKGDLVTVIVEKQWTNYEKNGWQKVVESESEVARLKKENERLSKELKEAKK